MDFCKNIEELEQKGYSIIDQLFSYAEITKIRKVILDKNQDNDSFLVTKDLFAIRQLLKVIPSLKPLLLNENLYQILKDFEGAKYFLTKAIYFDKPGGSNWFVAYHQDLSVSVDQKIKNTEYVNWTYKRGQYGVQPPLEILENIVTLRIHLDDTDISNGALKVIPGSHLRGIYRSQDIKWDEEKEEVCEIKRGGIMLMKPLTLHASNRTVNNKQRRVIHLEFSNKELKKPLQWLEREELEFL